nr:hypothetical protein [Tanacetum cinerariifolium]
MAGLDEGGGLEGTDDREEIPPPLTKEQIKCHVSALKSLIKSHNQKNKGDPIRLNFETKDTEVQDHNIVKGKEVIDEDLRNPFKEAQRTPLTPQIIEFAGEWPMLVWCQMFQQTLDGSARGWIERLPLDNINEWADLREAFVARFSVRRACFKEPCEITKIIRRANESLTAFKERWMVETGFIMVVPEIMKISSFMDSVKSPELAKHFSEKVPTTVNEMMERSDDFVRSKEAYASTELPKGETGEDDYQNRHRGRDTYCANRTRDDRAPYPPPRGEYNRRVALVLSLDSLTKCPKEILATKTQLRLLIHRPMLNPLRSRNTDQYCDYHQEKDHYTNDCIQLGKQLEMALESGKLNHLVNDVRRGGKGPHGRDDPQPAKIINVISVNSVKDKKRKVRETTKSWMDIPITFLAISAEDIFEEPLIVLVKRVYVDEGSSVDVMFEHCFENLNPKIKAGLRETQTDLVGEARFKDPPSHSFHHSRNDEVHNSKRGSYAGYSNAHHCGVQTVRKETNGQRKHALNMNPSLDPVRQKRRTFSIEKSRVVTNEVAEWVKAGIVRPVKYLTYISNIVMVKKWDETWRMCIDFKNLNSTCLKDYYPLLNINCKVESVMGFKYKCFLDAYKGYHQIQMAEEDKEKTTFYIDQVTYCYTKMPFGLKNAGATYQRLVDSTFQSQIRRNLEVYVDDIVIKSRDEKMLLADISKTFDNLKKINMKLNLKKCPFGVEEGKFLGYMVTSEGIKANHKKTKTLADLQSPRTLKEMQSLGGKLAALNRFFAKTLNEAERNYALMEKLALALIHMTRRLRMYFEAHPVKVITDQLIKNILNNTETSRKIEKHDVELGAYNIIFIPRNAMKGQVLADFLSEAPEGEKEELYFRMLKVPLEKDNTESWTLFTDEASSPKGSRAGLVLIGPSGIEYTSALRLTFPSTNNEADYEALLAGLRIARQMNISNIEVKVESKLVAIRINGSYEASKDGMIKYLAKEKEYAFGFKSYSIENIHRNMNQKVDVLSKLASVAFNHLTKEVLVKVINERSTEGQEIHTIEEEEGDNWMTPIRRCLEEGIWPKDKNEARCQLCHTGDPHGILRHARRSTSCSKKVVRQRYYWPIMHEDAKKEVEKCMDILGPLPPVRGGAKFVIVAIEYFTKWIKAKPVLKITGKEVIRFVMDNIICRFGLPRIIVTDNGAQLINNPFKIWCGRFEIHQMNTTVAHPQVNGLVERDNRSLMEGIKTRLGREKVVWVDELPNVLWADRTSIKQSNGETPFSLTDRRLFTPFNPQIIQT